MSCRRGAVGRKKTVGGVAVQLWRLSRFATECAQERAKMLGAARTWGEGPG